MTATKLSLDRVASEFLALYGILTPPVPIEAILQRPQPGMWDEIDLSAIAGSLLSARDIFSTRLALARLLAQHICLSTWGHQRGLTSLAHDASALHRLARALLIPRDLLYGLPPAALQPTVVHAMFQAPESEARQRLVEVGVLYD